MLIKQKKIQILLASLLIILYAFATAPKKNFGGKKVRKLTYRLGVTG